METNINYKRFKIYYSNVFQAQFNAFVLSLRAQYSNKVKTFRQVIELHRLELNQKQQYWDEALVVSYLLHFAFLKSDLFHMLMHNFEHTNSFVEFWGKKSEAAERQENTSHSKQVGIWETGERKGEICLKITLIASSLHFSKCQLIIHKCSFGYLTLW